MTQIQLNGSLHTVTDGCTVGELVRDLTGRPATSSDGSSAPGIAVAVDEVVVPRAQWDAHVLAADARVEVLTAVQGG